MDELFSVLSYVSEYEIIYEIEFINEIIFSSFVPLISP